MCIRDRMGGVPNGAMPNMGMANGRNYPAAAAPAPKASDPFANLL